MNMCVACDNDGVVWVFDLFSCCDDDNYVVTMLRVSVTICPDHVCALHHPGLHPSSLWPAGPYQPKIFSLTKLLRPLLDDNKPLYRQELDQSQGWLFTPRHNFNPICSQLRNMILGRQQLIKSPVILPLATERRVPPGAQQETISQKIPSRVGND